MKYSTDDLLHSIHKNAQYNLNNNQPVSLKETVECANGYISKFRSSITRDLLNVADRTEAREELLDAFFEVTYLHRVMDEYIHILEVINEVETEELTKEIITEQILNENEKT